MAAPGLDLLALALRCRAEFATDNGVFKGKRLVNWLVCYDAVARDKALVTAERLRAGRMFSAKSGGDVVLLDSDDLYVMSANPHTHEPIPARAESQCSACAESLAAPPGARKPTDAPPPKEKEKERETAAGCLRCKRCGEEVHAACAKNGSPICVTDTRPLSAAARRASFMIPTEDKEAVISKFAHLRLPPLCTKPTGLTEKGQPKFLVGDVGPDCRPLVVFINRKSGGQQGAELLAQFQVLLDPHQVFDLSDGGPRAGLLAFQDVPNHLVLACGGDGTVGWVLGVMDGLQYPNGRPAVAILPLGTGNDLARVMGWGPGYNGEKLSGLLYKISRGDVIQLDRWQVRSVPYGTNLPPPPAPAPVAAPASPVPAPASPLSSSQHRSASDLPPPVANSANDVSVTAAAAPASPASPTQAEAPLAASPSAESKEKSAPEPGDMHKSASEQSSLSTLSASHRAGVAGAPPVPTSPKPRSRRMGESAKKNPNLSIPLGDSAAKSERSASAAVSPSRSATGPPPPPSSPQSLRVSPTADAVQQPAPQSSPAPLAVAAQAPAQQAVLPVVAAAAAVPGETVIVLNNYMSIGFDADIALQFHEAREANPSHFKSRSINKLWYVKFSTPTMLGVDKLKKHVTITVDGQALDLKDVGSLILLNIPSYSAGADLWRKSGKSFAHPSMSDGKIEVVGLTSSWHLGRIQTGVEGAMQLAQGSVIHIKVSDPRVFQVDGEAKRSAAVEYYITRLNQVPMLRSPDQKNKHHHHHHKSEEELKKLLAQMGDASHGLRVFDIDYNGKTYPRVFTGRAAVDWLVHHLKVDREHAKHLGGQLFSLGHLQYQESHLSAKPHHHFKDDYLYYKFKEASYGRIPQHSHPFLALLKVTVVEAEEIRSLPFSSGPKLRLSLDNQWVSITRSSTLGERRVFGDDLYFVVSRSDSVLAVELLADSPIGDHGDVRIPIASLQPHTRYDSVHVIRSKASTLGKIRVALTYRPMFTTRDDGHFYGLPEPLNVPRPQAGHTLACCASLATTLYGLYPDTGRLPVVSGTLPENLRGQGDVTVLLQSARLLRSEAAAAAAAAEGGGSMLMPIIEVSSPPQSSSLPPGSLENSVMLPAMPMSPRLPIAQPPPPNSSTLWTQLGSAHVDDKGRYELSLPEHVGSVPGFYRVRCVVGGASIPGQLFLVPKGASVALFSVEGVIAPDVSVLNDKNYEDDRGFAQVREGAVALARAWAAKGVLPLYITTHLGTPRWLKNRGFPPGPVSLATFADTLAHLRTHGWLIEAAYVREPEEVRLLREGAMLPSARLFLVSPRDRKSDSGVDLGELLSPNVLRILREAAPPNKPVPPLCVSW